MNFSRSLKTSSQLIQPVGNKVLCGHRKVGGGDRCGRDWWSRKGTNWKATHVFPLHIGMEHAGATRRGRPFFMMGSSLETTWGMPQPIGSLCAAGTDEMFHRKLSFSVRKHCHPVEDFSEKNVLKGRRP